MDLTFVTERLVLIEATEDDVDGLLRVALSNPDFTGDHEGSNGEPERFDRDMLERDLAVAWNDPARHPLVIGASTTKAVSSDGLRCWMSTRAT